MLDTESEFINFQENPDFIMQLPGQFTEDIMREEEVLRVKKKKLNFQKFFLKKFLAFKIKQLSIRERK